MRPGTLGYFRFVYRRRCRWLRRLRQGLTTVNGGGDEEFTALHTHADHVGLIAYFTPAETQLPRKGCSDFDRRPHRKANSAAETQTLITEVADSNRFLARGHPIAHHGRQG